MKFKPKDEVIGYILSNKAYCRKCGERASNKVKAQRLTRDEIITVYDACGTQVYWCDECRQNINFLAVSEWD